ncbi:MAG: LysR family transcriptional regulator, partial [Myxococcota bacterium]
MASVPWDDFRVLLAVARAGSIRAAATTLDTSHATVSRRLAGLRERLGVRLFERQGRRLRPTVAGAELVEVASRIADEMDDATRRVVGRDFELRGTVRVSLTDAIAQFVAPDLAAFAEAH